MHVARCDPLTSLVTMCRDERAIIAMALFWHGFYGGVFTEQTIQSSRVGVAASRRQKVSRLLRSRTLPPTPWSGSGAELKVF